MGELCLPHFKQKDRFFCFWLIISFQIFCEGPWKPCELFVFQMPDFLCHLLHKVAVMGNKKHGAFIVF